MNKVLRGIARHEVILLNGDNIRDLMAEYVYCKYVHETFSAINMDLDRVSSVLSAKRWDGTRPVVVFFRCEAWIKEISPLIRDRQPKQAVILVSDGDYSSNTPIMKSIASIQITVGRMPPTIFSMLKTGSVFNSVERYKQAIEAADVYTVIDQIHYTNPDNAVSCALSDVDILRYHVPEDVLSDCLPIRKSIEHKSNKKIETKTASNLKFAKTLVPILSLSTHSLMSVHETMEYIRYAHQIKVCPNISQCPRDDCDPRLVKNVNDKIRVLTCLANTSKRDLQRDSTMPPKKVQKLQRHQT
jgi:hypothetical protein